MFDVGFYMKVNELKKKLEQGEIKDTQYIYDRLEDLRNKKHIVYNIETTNACNMKCKMCPRTTMMTRKVETMDRGFSGPLLTRSSPILLLFGENGNLSSRRNTAF